MLFHSSSVDILKLDFVFEAGTACQPQPLCAASTAALLPLASKRYDARYVAEFLDYRGILTDTNTDLDSAALTVYLQPKYAAEFFPILHALLTEPAFPEAEFQSHVRKTRQQLLTHMRQASYMSRMLFRQALYGTQRPEGRYAVPDDVDALSTGLLRRFFAEHYHLAQARLCVSGHYDDALLDSYRRYFGHPDRGVSVSVARTDSYYRPKDTVRQVIRHTLDANGPQCSLRVGRILPFDPESYEAACFTVLLTVLGGYFGSRLMQNVREDKGYTYGIYSRARLFRSGLMFEVLSDVAADKADAALTEVYREMDRLAHEPVGDDELQLVRHYMEGEYLRSIDGLFERADRAMLLATLGVDEATYTQQLLRAIREVTPSELQLLAARYLDRDTLTEVTVR